VGGKEGGVSVSGDGEGGPLLSPKERLAKRESLYQDALKLRDSGLSSSGEILDVLAKAAGARYEEAGSIIGIPEVTHPGALFELYNMYENGINVTRNRKLAAAFLNGAAQHGWPDAQAEMGFREAMGLHNASSLSHKDLTSIDHAAPGRALLHYYFAALQNSSFASTVLGYRHSVGLGVPKSCPSAVLYYNTAAEEVIKHGAAMQGFPQVDKMRLSYKTMSGVHRGREQEVLQYYQYSADLGNVEAQTAVGHLFNQGAQGLERNHKLAFRYFSRAAEQDDPKAMSHLGHMYANGQGVESDNATALKWFNMAAQKNHPSALYGLGYLYLTGYGVKKDYTAALNYFTLAAEQANSDAQFHLGVMHLKGWGVKMDRQRAFYYFNLASHAGHALAQYNAAMMQLASDPSTASCEKALALLKQVAERGLPAETLQRARNQYLAGSHSDALWSYLRASEMGSELGMANAAFMLRNKIGATAHQADWLAVQLFSRASDQMNVNALLQVADSYYYGRGVKLDWGYAAQLYEKATERSSQALFNLGYMHQFGAGLKQDLHLAKRYYDLARAQDPDAALPVQLALWSLQGHSFMESILPILPSRTGIVLQQALLSVKQPQSSLPEHHMPSLGWLDALLDYLDWEAPAGQQEGTESSRGDSYDTALLLFLCIGLAVVLRRRRALRQLQAEREQLDNMDPVGGLVENADLQDRQQREWAEAVRRREAAHQQRQHQIAQQPQPPPDEEPAAADVPQPH